MEAFIPLFTQLATVGVVLLIVAALVAAVLVLRTRIRQPALHAVLDALGEFALMAVYGAENLSLDAFNKLDNVLEGWDKKAIADSIYDLLPNTVTVGGRTFPISFIKTFVTRDVWEDFVQRKFGEADSFLHRNRDYLIKQVDGLAEDLKRAEAEHVISIPDSGSAVG